MNRLKRVYVEITNRCNLRCSFCPGTRRPLRDMTAAEFALLAARLRPYADYFYLHVMGEPLFHPQLKEILSICAGLEAKVIITTNGVLLPEQGDTLLSASALYKLSVSLHSMEGNGAKDLTAYLSGVWDFVSQGARQGIICALRLWNIGGADARNGEILDYLAKKGGIHPLACPQPRQGSWRLSQGLYLEQAERFDWPDLAAPASGTAFCRALRDQAAVLADGTVVPCCLDHEGDIPLGNLFNSSLPEILSTPRAQSLYNGFTCRCPTEELCRRCGYATRFGQ